MFQQKGYQFVFVTLFFSLIAQDRVLFAGEPGLDLTAGKLNRDSFLLCREIRTKLYGIRGQRVLFSKAYEIHEMADRLHRMVVLNAPVRGMDQALSDLRLLVDDMNHSMKTMGLPVFRDPVMIPTGPNGYVFYGGNGYPQPTYQCDRFFYRMIPEQSVRGVSRILSEMESSITELQAYYSPQQQQVPSQRSFPVPSLVPRSDSKLKTLPAPLRSPDVLQDKDDTRWQPSRRFAPILPPEVPRNQVKPPKGGPQILPPLPSNG